MGYNNEQAWPVVFDLETVGIPDAADYLTEPIEAPANWKDPEKIARYLSDKRAEQISRAALDPDLCRIVALGFWCQAFGPDPVVWTAEPPDEAGMLTAFWERVGSRRLVGFNVLDFDLPVLLRRSLYLNVTAPAIALGKYAHPRVVDVMQALAWDGKLKYRSLSFYVRRFGLEVPADQASGREIAALVDAGDWPAVVHHCQVDVIKTRALAERAGLLKDTIRPTIPAGGSDDARAMPF